MQIIYPPRPKGKIPPHRLASYQETNKWVVQRKFNGTHIVLYVEGDSCCLLNRQGKPADFKLTKAFRDEIFSLGLDRSLKYWFDGELLDKKTKTAEYKEKIILFDILQAGRYLFGSPNLLERQEILKEICHFPKEKEPNRGIALRVTNGIWLAETFSENFVDRYKDFIDMPEIEGLVLKRKDSTLDNFGQQEYEVDWLIRCRKENQKSYRF